MSKSGVAGWLLIAACFALMLYLSLRSVAALDKGYSWSDMDWNRDGNTSLSEFLSAGDVGMRQTKRYDRDCKEYFSYKDRLPIKTVCLD
ncbi:hypothetical protein [Lysobacter sp. Hz 25]|uniref:hypothetical protein n=1 Tax=Lysobacter sp. Hz 25 TaxID=3383698 RepID=UPI0038D35A08